MQRRQFITKTVASATGAIIIPTIIPSGVMGKNPPSDMIQVAQIGYGRIASGLDVKSMLRRDDVRVIAISDVDSKRMADGKKAIEDAYKEKGTSVDVKMYDDYREIISRTDIDAVVISTPDHWHAQPAIEAALSGKDFFLQKPTTLTIAEGKLLAETVRKKGTISQICTQHRCSDQFRLAAELVRNGRIGKLHTVYIGIGGESPGPDYSEEPVPSNLNYEMWLGSTPWVYYTESGVHPQEGYGRPGWMKRHQFGAGGITNTGQHYIDVAAWGMNTERTGPVSVEAVGLFPTSGLFDVPKDFMVIAEYQNGIRSILGHKYPSGVRYEGTDGWISAGPGSIRVTDSDPDKGVPSRLLDASDKNILESKIGENEIHLLQTKSLHNNWLDCVKSREQTLVPAEVAHRSCSIALLGDIAMHVGRRLNYDPAKEQFINDNEANSMISRPQRRPYGTDYIKM
ncbi:MAG: Gfo/Idh/MocA family oxidoreductase [Prolixibacteraceae bacterium]|nr:Gfo/Idh/MocA family oxidoreductase [Prolixibacteraceae bacterium]